MKEPSDTTETGESGPVLAPATVIPPAPPNPSSPLVVDDSRPAASPAAANPAANAVLNGDKTEREIALEEKLKAREIELAQREDEIHRLTKPEPVAVKPAKVIAAPWMRKA